MRRTLLYPPHKFRWFPGCHVLHGNPFLGRSASRSSHRHAGQTPSRSVETQWRRSFHNLVIPNSSFLLGLCLINLFRFCPAAIITPSYSPSQRFHHRMAAWERHLDRWDRPFDQPGVHKRVFGHLSSVNHPIFLPVPAVKEPPCFLDQVKLILWK